MVADGLFERFPVDAVFGMHNGPSFPVGKFAMRAGPMMAGGASFDIVVTGKGAHGAGPENAIDPMVAAAHIVTALQTIVARNVDPRDAAVLSITQIHGGDAYNVIPETAVLRGTARAFNEDVMGLIETRMRRISEGVAHGLGASAALDFRVIFPPLVNHADETKFAGDIAAVVVGEENVDRDGPLIAASEDFAYMLNARPGAYIRIGNGGTEGGCPVHNPGYDFNDAALPLGASFFARLVEARLAKPAA